MNKGNLSAHVPVRSGHNNVIAIKAYGFTSIELLLSVFLLSVGAALSFPSYQDAIEKKQMTDDAKHVLSMLNSVPGLAQRESDPVTVSYQRSDTNEWCFGATVGSTACDCLETEEAGDAYCSIDSVRSVITSSVPIKQNGTPADADSIVYSFHPDNHFFTEQGAPVILAISSENGYYLLNFSVGSDGKASACSVNADRAVPGYEHCTP